MTLATKIKSIRKALQRSQTQCAIAAGVSPSVWSSIEANRPHFRNPKLARLQQVAKGLGCTVATILDGVDLVEGADKR